MEKYKKAGCRGVLTQPTFTCSKSTTETTKQCVKSVQNSKLTIKTQERRPWRALVSLLLTLNRFHTLFWCFHCWLWASKCCPGRTLSNIHCVKSVQIRSYFWSVFYCIRTEYGDLRSKFSPNTGKYGPEKNPVFGQFSRSDPWWNSFAKI